MKQEFLLSVICCELAIIIGFRKYNNIDFHYLFLFLKRLPYSSANNCKIFMIYTNSSGMKSCMSFNRCFSF
ncbi:unnamed protein product [Acanthoscelides obtectus]|uniref:Uncharacterized protein n=1 Tax=Acanthoscelides obtectus TaxID=200917 RepID=A0A9P0LV82_ACAOB|nr:unnamed protein product [Acanthoscelides obtectus]CAK1644060.1 hypothetical protein AOBTE_LOCUS13801 [Acanthoscelides obtectus]